MNREELEQRAKDWYFQQVHPAGTSPTMSKTAISLMSDFFEAELKRRVEEVRRSDRYQNSLHVTNNEDSYEYGEVVAAWKEILGIGKTLELIQQ